MPCSPFYSCLDMNGLLCCCCCCSIWLLKNMCATHTLNTHKYENLHTIFYRHLSIIFWHFVGVQHSGFFLRCCHGICRFDWFEASIDFRVHRTHTLTFNVCVKYIDARCVVKYFLSVPPILCFLCANTHR